MNTFSAKDLNLFLSSYDEQKQKMFADVYLTSLGKHKANCIQAIKNKDIALLKSEMHDFKTLGSTVKYQELATIAEQIEQDIKNNSRTVDWGKAEQALFMIDHLVTLFEEHR